MPGELFMRDLRLTLLSMGSLCLLVGCSTQKPREQGLTLTEAAEVAFGFLMDQPTPRNARVFYLETYGEDAPTEVLAIFGNSPVRPASEFKEGQGVKLHLDRVGWEDVDTYTVRCGFFRDGLCFSTFELKIRMIDGRWSVRDYRVLSHG